MTKYEVKSTSRFRKDLKLMQKRKYNISLLNDVVKMLADGTTLPESYKDHSLSGDWEGHRECHILPDWLLVYRIENDTLILVLSRTGTHSDLF
jgi:mRNA interferase YafQ